MTLSAVPSPSPSSSLLPPPPTARQPSSSPTLSASAPSDPGALATAAAAEVVGPKQQTGTEAETEAEAEEALAPMDTTPATGAREAPALEAASAKTAPSSPMPPPLQPRQQQQHRQPSPQMTVRSTTPLHSAPSVAASSPSPQFIAPPPPTTPFEHRRPLPSSLPQSHPSRQMPDRPASVPMWGALLCFRCGASIPACNCYPAVQLSNGAAESNPPNGSTPLPSFIRAPSSKGSASPSPAPSKTKPRSRDLQYLLDPAAALPPNAPIHDQILFWSRVLHDHPACSTYNLPGIASNLLARSIPRLLQYNRIRLLDFLNYFFAAVPPEALTDRTLGGVWSLADLRQIGNDAVDSFCSGRWLELTLVAVDLIMEALDFCGIRASSEEPLVEMVEIVRALGLCYQLLQAGSSLPGFTFVEPASLRWVDRLAVFRPLRPVMEPAM
ncbi:hypothetical protein DFJ73DRAFT_807674 [Zopfochytrium polystomum]|nr:hypothetical protein DFJ73DRAFT_807674 [Zopfochytrium polystomum]